MELQAEYAFFDSKREELLEKYSDKYVLIKGKKLLDVFTSLEDAYKEGVKLFGTQSFFIKQVLAVEPIEKTPSLMLGITHANI